MIMIYDDHGNDRHNGSITVMVMIMKMVITTRILMLVILIIPLTDKIMIIKK